MFSLITVVAGQLEIVRVVGGGQSGSLVSVAVVVATWSLHVTVGVVVIVGSSQQPPVITVPVCSVIVKEGRAVQGIMQVVPEVSVVICPKEV